MLVTARLLWAVVNRDIRKPRFPMIGIVIVSMIDCQNSLNGSTLFPSFPLYIGAFLAMSHNPPLFDHGAYQRHVRRLSVDSLRYIMRDAREAIAANPDGTKAGWYADEIAYCSQELKRRGLVA